MDDTVLLRAFQQGDGWAEKNVFDRFFEPLVLFSERMTGNVLVSEDIVVEALTKAIDRRLDFLSVAKLKSFLYQVTYNASINQVTSDQRHRIIHEKIRYQQQHEPGVEAVLETEVLRAEILQEIYAEVENLPDKCGQIFKMIFVEELSTDVIADRLGINVQTVRSQKARAIGLIRTALLKKKRLTTLIFFCAWLKTHLP
jgi:RNA polymerase sigma-70 factor (ECF subfamily)